MHFHKMDQMSGARPPVTWRAVRYALKHLFDEGKISSYSDRPPDVYYIKATVHAAPIKEAMEIIG